MGRSLFLSFVVLRSMGLWFSVVPALTYIAALRRRGDLFGISVYASDFAYAAVAACQAIQG